MCVSNRSEPHSAIRLLLPFGVVAALLQLARTRDVFSQFTKPVVTGALQVLGMPASDQGTSLLVGQLEIPWTRDCAGLNLLLILMALVVWMMRSERWGLGCWLRLGAMVPAALLANILRVLTIVAYRHWFYPAVESPQMHYLFGLVWLVPILLVAVPTSTRRRLPAFAELIHAAAVVALLAPITDTAGGLPLTVAVVLCLAHCRCPESMGKMRLAAFVAWCFAGLVIAGAEVESLWMPWLLLCPVLADARWLRTPQGAVLVIMTCPLTHLLPGAEWATWAAVAYAVWKEGAPEPPAGAIPGSFQKPFRIVLLLAMPLFFLPFAASVARRTKTEAMPPPSGIEATAVPGDGYQLSLPGQSPDIGVLWYEPQGSVRHHTLAVCLKYRGIELKPVPGFADVMTDGEYWFREFFLQGGRLVPTYFNYLKATLMPRSSPGVHLIIIGHRETMSPAAFNTAATALAGELNTRFLAQRRAGGISGTR